MTQTRIDSEFQTPIPEQVRRELGLRSGDALRWEVVGKDIRLIPARRRFLDRRGSLKVGPGSTNEDVRRARVRRGTEDSDDPAP